MTSKAEEYQVKAREYEQQEKRLPMDCKSKSMRSLHGSGGKWPSKSRRLGRKE